MRRLSIFLALPLGLAAQFSTNLKPVTKQAFDSYTMPAEARMNWQPRFSVSNGDVVVAPIAKDGAIEVKSGMIHDWAAATVANGASVSKVLAVLQSYNQYSSIYAPEVAESKLLGHDGNHWQAFLKLVKKKALTVVLNSEYDVEYRPLNDGRWAVISRSTKMTELDGGKELAPGTGHGFLWNLNAYWLIEPRPGGVYLECRTLSLTRDIPTGLGWVVKPFVSSLPKESLRATLEATVRALR